MKLPRRFFQPLATGAPAPFRELPVRLERMIHFVPPHNDKVRARVPGAKIIVFARGSGLDGHARVVPETGADAVGVDWGVDLKALRATVPATTVSSCTKGSEELANSASRAAAVNAKAVVFALPSSTAV